MKKITLGSMVEDNVSGLVGTVTSRTEFLNGCIQYGIQPKIKKGATEIPTWNIDEAQLKVIKAKPVKRTKRKPGGPTTKI